MKLPLAPSARAGAIALALTSAFVGTLVAVVPAGAATGAATADRTSAALSRIPLGRPVTAESAPGSPTATPSPTATSVPVTPAPATTAPSAPAASTPAPSASASTPQPSTKPTTPPAPKAAPKPVTRPSTPAKKSAPVVRHVTTWGALNRAISAIPHYASASPVRWVISSRFGHYGMTDWYHNTIYLSPSIPASELASVAKHEYGHILEARAYGGDIQAMITALNRIYGGGGRGNLNGAERAADCIALVNGASWTHYTGCGNPTWRAAARRLIAGQRV